MHMLHSCGIICWCIWLPTARPVGIGREPRENWSNRLRVLLRYRESCVTMDAPAGWEFFGVAQAETALRVRAWFVHRSHEFASEIPRIVRTIGLKSEAQRVHKHIHAISNVVHMHSKVGGADIHVHGWHPRAHHNIEGRFFH